MSHPLWIHLENHIDQASIAAKQHGLILWEIYFQFLNSWYNLGTKWIKAFCSPILHILLQEIFILRRATPISCTSVVLPVPKNKESRRWEEQYKFDKSIKVPRTLKRHYMPGCARRLKNSAGMVMRKRAGRPARIAGLRRSVIRFQFNIIQRNRS